LSPNWFWYLWLAARFPDTLVTAQEAAEVLGVTVDHARRLIRSRRLPATRRCNRHVLKLTAVLEARLGVLGEKGGSPKNGKKKSDDETKEDEEVRDA